ncbi:MAG: site-specific integrase [Terriglobales bacterium]
MPTFAKPAKVGQPSLWKFEGGPAPPEPESLLTILKELPRRGKLVFANSSGNMYTQSWDDAKAIGEKAKVRDSHPHRFRATFATTLLQNGVDLKTVQKLLGHKNLESTMQYLAKAESPKVRAKVNAVWA